MLNRFAKVHADGTYVKPPNSKLSYGASDALCSRADFPRRHGVHPRTGALPSSARADCVSMISNSGWSLSRAITIAMRYAHVRRQFVDPDDPTLSHGAAKLERQVIHYASVHMRASIAQSVADLQAFCRSWPTPTRSSPSARRWYVGARDPADIAERPVLGIRLAARGWQHRATRRGARRQLGPQGLRDDARRRRLRGGEAEHGRSWLHGELGRRSSVRQRAAVGHLCAR